MIISRSNVLRNGWAIDIDEIDIIIPNFLIKNL